MLLKCCIHSYEKRIYRPKKNCTSDSLLEIYLQICWRKNIIWKKKKKCFCCLSCGGRGGVWHKHICWSSRHRGVHRQQDSDLWMHRKYKEEIKEDKDVGLTLFLVRASFIFESHCQADSAIIPLEGAGGKNDCSTIFYPYYHVLEFLAKPWRASVQLTFVFNWTSV